MRVKLDSVSDSQTLGWFYDDLKSTDLLTMRGRIGREPWEQGEQLLTCSPNTIIGGATGTSCTHNFFCNLQLGLQTVR